MSVAVGALQRWERIAPFDVVVVDKTAKGWVAALRAHGWDQRVVESTSTRGEGFEVVDWFLEGSPPRLTIDPSCEKSIEEFRNYRRDMRKDRLTGEMFATKNAHWTHSDIMDARRYALVYLAWNIWQRQGDRKLSYSKPAGYRPMGVLV